MLEEGSFLRKQVGPLPMWAWMLITLGAVLAYVSWRNARSPDAGGSDEGSSTLPADNLGPLYVIQNYDQDRTYVTVPTAPPSGGRPVPKPVPPPPPPTTKPPTTTTPKPAPVPPPAPAGVWVDVVKWAKGQPKGTPSTLWGIAEKVYGNGASWQQIWNAPQNAAVRAKRGTPEKVQQGDRFWVPTK